MNLFNYELYLTNIDFHIVWSNFMMNGFTFMTYIVSRKLPESNNPQKNKKKKYKLKNYIFSFIVARLNQSSLNANLSE